MSRWNDYQREERPKLEPGDYRVKIVDVEDTTSQAGNPMLVIIVQPNGSNIRIKHYIVKNEYYNANMTEFFDSFNIDEGDFQLLGWIGAVGAAKLVKDEKGYLKVRWFIKESETEHIPPWEGDLPQRNEITDFQDVEKDEDLPFA